MYRRCDVIKMSDKDKDKEAFFADSFSILFNPSKFAFDFKQNVPKIEPSKDDRKHKNVVWHQPILLDPVLAKKLSKVLSENVRKFEEKFGEIKLGGKGEKEEREEPSYIG